MTPQISQFQYLFPDHNSTDFTIQQYPSISFDLLQSITSSFSPIFPSSLGNNSAFDEADDEQYLQTDVIISDRKRRRMISNRESARRSRVRKQKQLDELLSQLVCLRNDNQSLMEQLNRLVESHDKTVEENARLKDETKDIRQMLLDFQFPTTSSD